MMECDCGTKTYEEYGVRQEGNMVVCNCCDGWTGEYVKGGLDE